MQNIRKTGIQRWTTPYQEHEITFSIHVSTISDTGCHYIGKNEAVFFISFMKVSFSLNEKRGKKRIAWPCLTNWRTNYRGLRNFLLRTNFIKNYVIEQGKLRMIIKLSIIGGRTNLEDILPAALFRPHRLRHNLI